VTLTPSAALGGLPSSLSEELLAEYDKIARNYREDRWEAAELDGGRFCEIAYTVCKGYLEGHTYPAKPTKPSRFPDACAALGKVPAATGPQSVRIGIPRVLVGLYDVRNNRGVGHVGGEVNANYMDATFVLHAVQWVMAEFIRIYHGTDTKTATSIVNALVDRTLPVIWSVGDRKRVLASGLALAKQTLLILYAEPGGRKDSDLAADLEQPRLANYKRVLRTLHDDRLVEYRSDGNVEISPKGSKLVEEDLLPTVRV